MGSWKDEVTLVNITPEQVEADLQCYICLDDLVAGEQVMKLSCSHHYHEPCISPWLDKNNICPTCRQKILCREDPDDPEEYDFEFDSGFLTDIIREINNIVYGVDSDEEFLYSDSPDIIELSSSSDGETTLSGDHSAHNERSSPSQDAAANVSEDSSDVEVVCPQDLESNVLNQSEQIILSEVSSGEETQNHQTVVKSVKRQRSFIEVEDSSDDEDTLWLPPDTNSNQQNTLFSQNAQPIKDVIPYSVNRSHAIAGRKKLRKRQRRSPESDESQNNQDSSDEEFEFHNNHTTEANQRKVEEKKQSVKGRDTIEEPKKGSNNRNDGESHDEESDDGVFVFDMVEVESLVSKLLEIMNQGEDESTQDEDVQSCPEEWSKRSVPNQENIKKNENSDDDIEEIYSNVDSKYCFTNKGEALSKSVELISEDKMNSNVLNYSLTTERNPSPCQRKGNRGKSVKRKISSSSSSDSENSEDKSEFPVKRKVSSSDSESSEDSYESPVKRKAYSSDNENSNDDDSDGFENIEQIISELWSIVGQDGEDSESDQSCVGGEKNCDIKTEKTFLTNKESPERHKRNQPTFQGKNN